MPAILAISITHRDGRASCKLLYVPNCGLATQYYQKGISIFSQFSLYDSFQPTKIQAYILFELLLKDTSQLILSFNNIEKNHSQAYPFFKDDILRTFRAMMECVELLLPEANEITQSFGINLITDPLLQYLRETTKQIPTSLIDERKAYEETLQKLIEIRRSVNNNTSENHPTKKKKSPKANQQSNANNQKQIINPLPQASIESGKTVTISTTSILKESKLEQMVIAESKKPTTKEQTQKALLIRQEKQAAKEKRITERRAIWAKEIVNQHNQEQLNRQEREQKERLQKETKIYELPSEDFVSNILIPSLSKTHTEYLEMLFSQKDNNNTMSHKEVVNLALHIFEELNTNGIDCAKDFYDYVISKIHHRHDSDKGDLLPKHYVDILRSCFIIFGIFPKDWSAQTKEDFDAINKYSQRRLDYIYYETHV